MCSLCSPMLSLCSPMLPHCSPMLPLQPLPTLPPLLCSCKFKRRRRFSPFWMPIREEPVMAPPTAHHVFSCSCPLALSLLVLLFPFTFNCLRPAATHPCTKCAIVYVVISCPLYISLPLSLFAVYASVARAVLSSYNFPFYLISNSEEEEDGGAILR